MSVITTTTTAVPAVKVTKELTLPPDNAAFALDPSLFQPSAEEWEFLRATIADSNDEIRKRVFAIQKETFAAYPYPCIYMFHFTRLLMASNEIYNAVVDAGKENGDTLFLDLGCHMGTDVRKLVLDGYPAQNIVACDLRQEFIDAGHKLFRDNDKTCAITFLATDIFDLTPGPAPTLDNATERESELTLKSIKNLEALKGRLTHLYAGSLFHIWNAETQYAVAVRFASLAKQSPGTIIFGRHQGAESAGIIGSEMGIERFGHDAATWTMMWKKAFSEIKSEGFAAAHVVVKATTGPVTLEGGLVQTWLFWSVHIM